MKLFSLVLILCFPLFSVAATGYEQVEKLFNEGVVLDIPNLKTSDFGMYTGRCFQFNSNYPYGAFVTFENASFNSGPIKVDPILQVAWAANAPSDYYDTINVDYLVSKVTKFKLENKIDKNTYEYNHPYNWVIQFRQNQNYIIQRNKENGIDHSFCYYFSFRNR